MRCIAVGVDGHVERDVTGRSDSSNEFVVDWRSTLDGPRVAGVDRGGAAQRAEFQTVFCADDVVGDEVLPRVRGRGLSQICGAQQLVNLGEFRLSRRSD